MKFRISLSLGLALIPTTACRGQTAVPLRPAVQIESISPEMIEALRNESGGRVQTNSGGNTPNSRNRQPTPEQQRTQMLQKIRINRTNSGILEARLAERNKAENPSPPPKPQPDPEKETAEQKKQRENTFKSLVYRREFEQFSRSLVLGDWDNVTSYLKALPDGDAVIA
ncbi:MAG: hypothetical protein ACPGAP_01355, partial [Akkermansiaceae bacterium]